MTDSPGEAARFLTRNAVDALPQGELERQLAKGRPLRVKLGVDPTTPDIHLGHTVVLRKLREFQDLGHTVVLIVGDYTARVGDPSGRSATRPQVDPGEIDRNAETYEQQAYKILDRERTELRRNGEWLDMPMEDLFRLARTSTVAQLLERDDFAKRYAGGQPISILELLYPLLQGYDSVAIESDVELGGTDQSFNLLLAREVQKAYGVEPQSMLTMPILPGIDGVQKMSKSLNNYVGVDEPPEEMFGKLMRVPDEAMPVYYELLLDEAPQPDPREAKRHMAHALTARYHGEDAARAAQERFDTVHVRHELPDDIEEFGFNAETGRCTSPPSWRTPSGSHALRPAGCSVREASSSTARSSKRWTCRPRSSTGSCSRWASGASSGFGSARLTGPELVARPLGGATLLRRAGAGWKPHP